MTWTAWKETLVNISHPQMRKKITIASLLCPSPAWLDLHEDCQKQSGTHTVF